jgi:hypothetical protein
MSLNVVYSTKKVIGSASDPHVCKASAGYAWCSSTNQCERSLELAKKYTFTNAPTSFNHFCKNEP